MNQACPSSPAIYPVHTAPQDPDPLKAEFLELVPAATNPDASAPWRHAESPTTPELRDYLLGNFGRGRVHCVSRYSSNFRWPFFTDLIVSFEWSRHVVGELAFVGDTASTQIESLPHSTALFQPRWIPIEVREPRHNPPRLFTLSFRDGESELRRIDALPLLLSALRAFGQFDMSYADFQDSV